jgi:hypothetical protein
MTLRAFLLVLCALALTSAGCARDFLLVPDAGATAPDAARPTDAATQTDTTPSPDAGACTGGIAWLDDAPWLRSTSAEGVLVAGHDDFVIVTAFLDSDAWRYWIDVDRLPPTGPVSSSTEGARFFGESLGLDDAPPRLFAAADPSGQVHVAASGRSLWWSDGPDWDRAVGSLVLDPDTTLGAVAFEERAILVEEHTAVTGIDGTLHAAGGSGRVSRVTSDLARTPLALDPGLSFEYWSPSLASHAEGPWLAVLNAWDFPPTVQLAGPAGTLVDGSSCGVSGFDLVVESGRSAVVAEDCGGTVRVTRRSFDARTSAEITDRDPTSTEASQLASDGQRFALAYRGVDGRAHVALLDADLALLATSAVPGSATPSDHIAGPLGVAALRDGTYAVLTTVEALRTGPGAVTDGTVSVQRFRACE